MRLEGIGVPVSAAVMMKESKPLTRVLISPMKLSVVIPVYNEKSTLQDLLQRVRNVSFDKEIILVDDCSVDGTRDLLKQLQQTEPDLKIFFHENDALSCHTIVPGDTGYTDRSFLCAA